MSVVHLVSLLPVVTFVLFTVSQCKLHMLFLYILPTLHIAGTVVLAGILTLDGNT